MKTIQSLKKQADGLKGIAMRKIFFYVVLLGLIIPNVSQACLQSMNNNSICRGDSVIDNDNDMGVVLEVFNNGKVKIDYHKLRKHYIKSINNVSKEIRCYGQVCRGDQVVDNDNDAGTVLRVYENGRAYIDYFHLNKHYVRTIRQLSKSSNNQCYGRLCKGSIVIDNENDIGTILQVYDNGKILIDYIHLRKHYYKTANQLSLSYRCSDGLCVGDRIIDNENDTGKVLRIFDNGAVQIDYDGYRKHYIKHIHSLGHKVQCYN